METNPSTTDSTRFRTASWTAAVAGVLMLVVGSLLAYDYSRRQSRDPLDSATFIALKNSLAQQPTNEEMKTQIRTIDRDYRVRYFRHKTFAEVGAMLMLISAAIFLVAGKTAVTLHRRLPEPQPLLSLEDAETKWTRYARWGVAGLAVIFAGGAIALSLASRSPLSESEEDLAAMLGDSKPAVAANIPVEKSGGAAKPATENPTTKAHPEPTVSDEDFAKSWPNFRGPGGRGISAFENIPTEWNAAEGKEKNLRWKTAVPLPGNGSPVVWKGKVFLSGADEKRHEVYCFAADSGKLLWTKPVPGTPQSTAAPPKVMPETGFAAPTPATDGRRVFAIFANGDLAAFDFEGNLAWSKSLGMPNSSYGFASSPTTYKNLLIVQWDQCDEKNPKSKLFAFDSATGKQVWKADRNVTRSWASPIVIRVGDRDEIVTAASPLVIAYDPKDGKEIWRVECLKNDVGPSPAFAAGKVFMANDGTYLAAIPADVQGNATDKILWKGEDGKPDTCSVLANEKYVLLMDANGILTCYDSEKGEKLWEDDAFDNVFSSSPSLMGNRVFLFGKEGKAWVIEPGKEKSEHVAENELGEECVTSPAFQDGCFYIRGKEHLFCFGKK
jgi:outer membrane protein assembly factor BamB